MANPTLKNAAERSSMDNLGLDVEQLVINNKVVISSQQAKVADAVVAHALNAVFSDTEVEAALDALGVKINAVLAILEAHGLMADA